MPTSSLVLGLDETGPPPPLVDNEFDDCRWDCGVIDQSNDQSAGAGVHLLDAAGDRLTHLAVRIRIEGESEAEGA